MVSYGQNREQYFLCYEPERVTSDKVIVWVHGGGWNAGNPRFFDFVGQCVCGQGYRFVSLGYRLSPKYKYPCQIKDVCEGFNLSGSVFAGRDTALFPWATGCLPNTSILARSRMYVRDIIRQSDICRRMESMYRRSSWPGHRPAPI